jgi:hypothetical protein
MSYLLRGMATNQPEFREISSLRTVSNHRALLVGSASEGVASGVDLAEGEESRVVDVGPGRSQR